MTRRTDPPPAIRKYLASRSHDGPWRIEGTDRRDFTLAVVIPALAEEDELFATLADLAANPADQLEQTLVLVVVNQPEGAPESTTEINRRTLGRLREGMPGLNLGLVDAASAGRELPARHAGVGMARKVGCDLALCRLSFAGTKPVLASLDADTRVRPDYLGALRRHFTSSGCGGATIPFCHLPAPNCAGNRAIERYELFLRHYVLGLELAGSPYAFHTVGSALASTADAYARAGGMNRRTAGEDFYFLQQLAKTVGVEPLEGTIVYPSPRLSSRTPFGTGPSVARLLAGEREAVTFYPSECFDLLGRWLAFAEAHLDAAGEALVAGAGAGISAEIADFLCRERFAAAWNRITGNHRTRPGRAAAFTAWFDGLKTLRLIHHLCAGSYPRCDADEALPPLFALAGLTPPPSAGAQLAMLRRLQSGCVSCAPPALR